MRTIIALGLMSLGSSLAGCASVESSHDTARTWMFPAAEMRPSVPRRELLLGTDQRLDAGTGIIAARGGEFRFTHPRVTRFLARFESDRRPFLSSAIAESPEAHGFDPVTEEPLRYDMVMVSGSLSLASVARLSGAPTSAIEDLNPALHRGIVPPDGYLVRLPKGTKKAFEIAYATRSRIGEDTHQACDTPRRQSAR